jgi:DNA-binding transcriptional MocR family regulator
VSFYAVVESLRIQDLDPGAKFVLVVLSSYASDENRAWPSQETLAFDTCMSPRSIRTHLTTLEARGLIKRDHRRLGNRRTSDVISLLFVPAKSATRPPVDAAKSVRSSGKKRHSDAANIAANPIIEPRKEITRASALPFEGQRPTRPASKSERLAIAADFRQLAKGLGKK